MPGYANSYAETEKIVLTNSDYWVEILTCLPRKALKKAEAALSQAVVQQDQAASDGMNVSMAPDVAGYRDLMVLGSISSWNLDDERGQVIPVTLDNVGLLSGADFKLIYERVDALNSPPTAAAQKSSTDQG
jgi:hypothetical protein